MAVFWHYIIYHRWSRTTVLQTLRKLNETSTEFPKDQPRPPPPPLGLHQAAAFVEEFQNLGLKLFPKGFECSR